MKTATKVKYFAYGSNMDINRLQTRVGKVKVTGVGILHYYKLTFNAGDKEMTQGSFANIEKTGNPKDFVEGIVFELTRDQMLILEQYEGAPHFYNKVMEEVGRHKVAVFISLNQSYRREPSITPEYFQHMYMGAKKGGLEHTEKLLSKVASSGIVQGFPKKS